MKTKLKKAHRIFNVIDVILENLYFLDTIICCKVCWNVVWNFNLHLFVMHAHDYNKWIHP